MSSSDSHPAPGAADWQLLREMLQEELVRLGEPARGSFSDGWAVGLRGALGYMDGIEQGLAVLGHLAVER